MNQPCPSMSAVIFGVLTVVLGHVSKSITRPWLEVQLPEICQKWNDNKIFEISLFLTGVLTYIVFYFAKTTISQFEWSTQQALLIALAFGVGLSIVSYIGKALVYPWLKVNLPDSCKGWNDKYVMEVSRFLTGFFLGFVVFTVMKKTDIQF